MRDMLRFDWKNGEVKLPAVLAKVCTHGSGPELEYRLRGDMGYDLDTFAGIRQEVYVCIQCGNTKSARALLIKMQKYMLEGADFSVGRREVAA